MLEAEGIAAARITVTDMSNMDPANTRDSEQQSSEQESNFRIEVNIYLVSSCCFTCSLP